MGMRPSAICEVVDKHVCQVAMPVPVGLATLGTWPGDVHVQPEGELVIGTPGLVLPVLSELRLQPGAYSAVGALPRQYTR